MRFVASLPQTKLCAAVDFRNGGRLRRAPSVATWGGKQTLDVD